MKTKNCPHCKQELSTDAFAPSKKNRSGYRTYCRPCERERQRQYLIQRPRESAEVIEARTKRYQERIKREEELKSRGVWVCTKCGTEKPLSDFYMDNRGAQPRPMWCKACTIKRTNEYSENLAPEARKRNTIKHRFGLTMEEYDSLLELQRGVCAICEQPPAEGKYLAIDHDHRCCPQYRGCKKCIRGLVCFNCNAGLGNLKDDIGLLERALQYLRNHPFEQ